MAFGSVVPADARLIRIPSWATLEAVWGVYEPPLVNQTFALVAVGLVDRDDLLLLARTGGLWIWD